MDKICTSFRRIRFSLLPSIGCTVQWNIWWAFLLYRNPSGNLMNRSQTKYILECTHMVHIVLIIFLLLSGWHSEGCKYSKQREHLPHLCIYITIAIRFACVVWKQFKISLQSIKLKIFNLLKIPMYECCKKWRDRNRKIQYR